MCGLLPPPESTETAAKKTAREPAGTTPFVRVDDGRQLVTW